MKKILYILLYIILCFPSLVLAQNISLSSPFPAQKSLGNLCFVENKSQWDKEILFRADVPNGFLFFKRQSLMYAFYDGGALHAHHPFEDKKNVPNDKINAHSVEVVFLNSNKNLAWKNTLPTHQNYNYFLGNNPKRWASDVKGFYQLEAENMYFGISAKFFSKEKSFKYEFYVQPNANTSDIKMEYKGTDSLKIDEKGNLIIKTSLNTFQENKPYAYQIIKGKEVKVKCDFILKNNVVSFVFPDSYDKNETLVIDPELVFSTYSGATADNWGSTATYDNDGFLYSGGIVRDLGTGFPTTIGAFQVTFGGINDVGILKFSPTGNTVEYVTYLGGNSSEFPHSLVVNSQKELVIFGTTGSSNFPTTANTFDATFNGGVNIDPTGGVNYANGTDIFIAKLSFGGNQLKSSTYLGGNQNDGIKNQTFTSINNYGDEFRGEVIVDVDDNIIIASTTRSPNFPTQNAYQTALRGGQDGVIVKFNPNLTQLIWSTYFGGSSFDAVYGLKINTLGNIYVTGVTQSINLRSGLDITTPAAFKNTIGGAEDGFLAEITSAGVVKQITYIGTDLSDQAFFVDFDVDDSPIVLGQTNGAYPISSATIYRNANSGQFIHKFSANLETSIFSTVIGAGRNQPDISPTAFMVNNCGNIYIAGWGAPLSAGRTTAGLPTTPDGFRTITDGGDFYIMILRKNVEFLLYATFFGSPVSTGDHVDGGTCRFDKRGIIYHAACASCGGLQTGFTTTPNAFSSTNNSQNCNNAAFKFDIGRLIVDFNIFDASTNVIVIKSCKFPYLTNIKYEGIGATSFQWKVNGVSVSTNASFNFNFPAAGDYVVELTASNPISCLGSQVVTKIFRVSQIKSDQNESVTICNSQSTPLNATLTSSNPFTFQWTPATGLSNANIVNPIATPSVTTNYQLLAVDNNGCEVRKNFLVTVIPPLRDDFDILNTANLPSGTFCTPANIRLRYDTTGLRVTSWSFVINNGGGTFNNRTSVDLTLVPLGTYTVTFTATRSGGICSESVSKTKTFIIKDLALVISPNVQLCVGQTTQLNVTGNSNLAGLVWTPSVGLSNNSIPNPIASPTRTTTYTVNATDGDGCQAQKTVLVEILGDVKADFEVDFSTDCAKPMLMVINNKSRGGVSFTWTLSNNVTFNQQNPPPYEFTQAGTYTLTLLAKNGACQDTKTITFDVENNSIPPPNVITPNKDGKNDVFFLPDRIGYQLEIYNRWGGLMYKTDNYKNDWGEDADNGVYYYLLTSPKGVKCKGWINVLK
ncbi:MAG: PKD domain-containing protein [Bacteroidetes bacterium]|nr:MAG: PKD domain-containing protein [Bacteroidota bacterium]TAG86629.1 MAG: PKD domain-containing protein [Bacteroidota bacterium]